MYHKVTTTRLAMLAGLLLTLLAIVPAHAATRTADLTRPVIDGVSACTQSDRIVTVANGRKAIQPYVGFDPLSAPQDLLDCYGIPPLPSTATGRAWWATTYAQSVYIPIEAGDLMPLALGDQSQTLTWLGNTYWSGYSADVRDAGNGSPTGIGFVSATFNVPHESQMPGSPHENVGTWVGMGGDDGSSPEIWQTGTQCGNYTTACAAFVEDYCTPAYAGNCWLQGAPYELNPSQFPVNAGDTFSPAVRWDGTFWDTDVQQNWHTTATEPIWGKGAFFTSSASWIMEYPVACGGCHNPAIDPTTDPVTFSNADSQGATHQNLDSWPTLRRFVIYDCYYTNLVDALPNVPYPGDQFTVQGAQASGHACSG